jgi:hypothetical protein
VCLYACVSKISCAKQCKPGALYVCVCGYVSVKFLARSNVRQPVRTCVCVCVCVCTYVCGYTHVQSQYATPFSTHTYIATVCPCKPPFLYTCAHTQTYKYTITHIYRPGQLLFGHKNPIVCILAYIAAFCCVRTSFDHHASARFIESIRMHTYTHEHSFCWSACDYSIASANQPNS